MGSSPAAAGAADVGRATAYEVADVVRAYGGQLGRTSAAERRVLRAITACRTAALGGHVEGCRDCGHERIAYNSCRNRHCPKCQGAERARWLAAERALLLPVPSFHVVFTLPDVLRPLVRANRRRLYDLLCRTAAGTLQAFARDPRHLGAEPGITMVLHTWGQTLTEHFHVHCLASGRGLTADGGQWRAVRRRRRPFLFPVRALSRVFRARYLDGVAALGAQGRLRLGPATDPAATAALLAGLRRRPWVVYAKPPFGDAERVLKYLSRYTHRVAIANQRLTYVGAGVVRFRYRHYAAGGREQEMTLGAGEFLRRFLCHVLPKGVMRVRHYGLLANCRRRTKLAQARALLEAEAVAAPPPVVRAPRAGRDEVVPRADRCPVCGGIVDVVRRLPRLARSDRVRADTA
jgi:hypothetical protein